MVYITKESKEVLLFGDGVYYGTSYMVDKFKEAGVEKTYAVKENVEDRGIELSSDCKAVGYDEIVTLLMEKHEKNLLI